MYIYIYIYVCIHVYIFLYIFLYIYIYIYICIYSYILICMYMYITVNLLFQFHVFSSWSNTSDLYKCIACIHYAHTHIYANTYTPTNLERTTDRLIEWETQRIPTLNTIINIPRYLVFRPYAHTHIPPLILMGAAACLPACLPAYVACWRRSLPPPAQFGRLPLHYAAEQQAGPEVVSALLLAYPDAASKADMVRCGADVGSVWLASAYVLLYGL